MTSGIAPAIVALVVVVCTLTERAGAQVAAETQRALAIAREVDRVAERASLWPGFDPRAIPLAIFTGSRTFLFRHPSAPPDFAPVPGSDPAALVYAGRHPAVTANSSADVGGVPTATLLAESARAALTPTVLAASAIHEAFHVFQRKRHPGWSGNEGDIFLYPVHDARLLALRRLESASLARALAAPDTAVAGCWARTALGYRRERFAAMDTVFPRYERLTELNEGLAAYVQERALGRSSIDIPPTEFPAVDFRERIYTIGPAFGFLLDRLRPDWKERLEGGDSQHLDGILRDALPTGSRAQPSCVIDGSEVAVVERVAREDASAVIAERRNRRLAFDALFGWRVVVAAADGQPLWPNGFDPLNVERVDGGVFHGRFLRLANDAAELRAIDEGGADIEALTEAAGEHPLFNGIRRVEVARLGKPAVNELDGVVTVTAPGFSLRASDATVETAGTVITVRLKRRP